jgi:hypothetical protein
MAKRITTWPAILIRLNPATLAVMRDQAEQKALPVSVLVRETLDARFREQPAEGR